MRLGDVEALGSVAVVYAWRPPNLNHVVVSSKQSAFAIWCERDVHCTVGCTRITRTLKSFWK